MIPESLWQAYDPPRFPFRKPPDHVDVVVIGGGITGLTAAHLLKRSGRRVALFEKGRIGGGETGHTSAHLAYVTDLRLTEIAKRFGKDAARSTWQAGAVAIDLIESNVAELGIDCGFRRVPGFLYGSLRRSDDESEELREESAAAKDLGFSARFLPSGPIRSKPAVAYADQGLFHPRAYLAGLARAVDGDGSLVSEEAEVAGVIDDPLAVIVNGENVTCDELVIATHVPLTGVAGTVSATLFQTKLYPYSTYVLGARIPHGRMSPGLYWDTSDPYYYLRVHEAPDHLYAIFGGEDHKTGQAEDTEACFRQLERTLLDVLPEAEIERRWSGQVIETSDGLPFMGRTADHQFAGTGYAGNGLTFGTIAGVMAHDGIVGVDNPWRELFDPDRRKLRGGLATVISENVDYPYHLILDRLRQDRRSGVDSVGRGEGKVLTVDGKRVACHRTDAGELVAVSAVCTHMGCLVRWNRAERTWDCPCHGSRFTPEGVVIGGPAEEPLERVAT